MSSRKSTLFAIRAPLPKRTSFVLGFVAPLLVLGAWCGLSYGGLVDPNFLPKPTEVLRGTLQLFLHYDLAHGDSCFDASHCDRVSVGFCDRFAARSFDGRVRSDKPLL